METTEIVQLVIALITTAIVIACGIIVFPLIGVNEELKRHIKDLEKKLSESEKKVTANLDEIRLLKWQIANPPKYKKGDKFGDLIVKSHELYKPKLGDLVATGIATFFTAIFFHKDTKYLDSLKEEFDKKMATQYMYGILNTVSGENTYMRELDLTNLIPAAK